MFVSAKPDAFYLADRRFFAFGVNCYFLAFAPEPVQREILGRVRDAGGNTIRAWAFYDRQEDLLAGLDRLLSLAEEHSIWLVLALENYWPDFSCSKPDDYFNDRQALAQYQRRVAGILERRNPMSGRRYLEEPAVLSWELMNEPRSSNRSQLLRWVASTAEFVKSIDSNHLLAVGDEGFFRWWWWRRVRQRVPRSAVQLYSGVHGTDAEALLSHPSIDFGSFHWYPEDWGVSPDFGTRWIGDHLKLGRRIGKPMLLEEFGLSAPPERGTFYRRWTAQMRADPGAGALLWALGSESLGFAKFVDKYMILGESELHTIMSA